MSLKSFYYGFSQFHENQKIIDFSMTLKGNVLLWAAVFLSLGFSNFLFIVPLMILAQFFPAKRMWIMSFGLGGSFLYLRLKQIDAIDPFWLVVDAAIVVGVLFAFFKAAQSFAKWPRVVRNSPQIFLHGLVWFLIIVISFFPVDFRTNPSWVIGSSLTVCLIFISFLVWRIGFMLYGAKRGTIKQTGFVDHLVYCLPYLGSTQVPFGKGLDYLLQKLAKHRVDLAKAQLAGLKLLLLANLWRFVMAGMDNLLFDSNKNSDYLSSFSIVKLYHLDFLVTVIGNQAPPLGVLWASLIFDMVYGTVQLAVRGHMIIGCLRLFGFNVFRNTYKPLLSTSFVEFWNRYYYYFKELLVDFFFFPVYLSYFKNRKTLRIFAAIMASAFFGNVYYHVLQRFDRYIESGEVVTFDKYSSYLFYSFVLAIGVFVSMLREQNKRGKPVVVRSPTMSFLVTVRKIAGVWLFFSIIRIWDHHNSVFWQDTRFFLSIFGIHL